MSVEPQSSSENRQREVFLAALERVDPGDRAEFLDRSCAGDSRLRAQVEDLLREAEGIGTFLEKPVLRRTRGSTPQNGATAKGEPIPTLPTDSAEDHIGRYRLGQKLGEGGCGVVYLAYQQEPLRREVALKIIKLGMDTKQVIARFEAERETLALMDHPNIAQVFDAGDTDAGRPYFVMELVRGVKLTDYCDQNRLSTEERLRLFVQVCHAIQHAHQKGIIHRDIKPSNILVTSHDGRPIPKVIDFGIARAITQDDLSGRTALTVFEQFIGTPAYMSPEQAEMRGADIDTRSDIYSLGVLLYELVTGRTPFDGTTLLRQGIDECRRTIREQEPPRPSTQLSTLSKAELARVSGQRRSEANRLVELTRGDLDWIVMKALEKDRQRRYPTAAAFAQDIEYYLANEPVLARPPSNLYRLEKLVHRHRWAFAATAGIAVALLLGSAVSFWQAIRAKQAETQARLAAASEVQLRRQAEHEREKAKMQAALARQNEYVADMNLAQQSLLAGNYGRAVYLLNKHRHRPGEADLRGFEWRYLWQLSHGDEHIPFPTQGQAVRELAVSPTGELLAFALNDQLTVWDLTNRSLVASVPQRVISMAFSKDGRGLFVGTQRGVLVLKTINGKATKLPGENSGPIALSKDGSRLATASREGVRIWDIATWGEPSTLAGASPPFDFSPDGKFVAANTPEGIAIWDLATSTRSLVLEDSKGLFFPRPWLQLGQVLAFSPDGRFIVAPRNSLSSHGVFVLGVWDARSGEDKGALPEDRARVEHTGTIASLAFSPDGATLATASMDHSIRLWDFPARRVITALHGHLSEVWAVGFLPDGRTVISGAKDGSVNLWPTHPDAKQAILSGFFSPLAFDKDGDRLAVLDPGRGAVVFRDVATKEVREEFVLERARPDVSKVALSADFGVLAEGLENGSVRLWDTRTKKTTLLKANAGPIGDLAISPDGRQLITSTFRQPLRWWDLQAGTNFSLAVEARRVLFAPGGRTLAIFASPDKIELWDTAKRSLRITLSSETQFGGAAAFSSDGSILATSDFPEEPEQAIKLWDTASGLVLGVCIGHKQGIHSIAFSADNRTLASSCDDSTLRLWNVATQQELLSFARLGIRTASLLFSPDGKLLIAGEAPQEMGIRFYSAPSLKEADAVPMGAVVVP